MSPPVATLIRDVFAAAVARDPDHEALVTRRSRYTYAELDAACDRAAVALAAMGVRPGDRVAASLPNEDDVVLAFHGAMRLGAVWVGINRALADPEKRFQLDDSGAALCLAERPVAGAGGRFVDVDEWRGALLDADGVVPRPGIDPFAPAAIAYTSGTTGRPKGAVHSQWNLLLPGAVMVAERGYGPALRKGDCLPLTILNMLVLTTLLVAQAHGTCIVMDRIDPEGVAEWIREERVTTWNGPPALLHGLAGNDAVTPSDLATLDEVWNGGADCPDAVRERFEAKFAKSVLFTYGLTEAPSVVSIDPRGGPGGPGASGVPLGHLAVHVVDEAGALLPPGATGEICVAPADDRYRLMLGYHERPEATAETLAGAMLHTGDIGFVDAHGRIVVRDRKKLVIVRGGANVYPAEVERVIHDHDEVEACAVFGVPDERLGERVAAAVQPVPGAQLDVDALRAHCAANLARYKVPDRVVFVDGFVRNAMGKIDRAALADLR